MHSDAPGSYAMIGQGGQGYVFEVERPVGEPLALKWYKQESATTEQHDEMQQLVEFGSPHGRFLWPMSMARVAGEPGFGYVMQLRDPRYLELSYLLSNTDRDGNPLDVSFASTIELCRQLSFSFLRLHARGLCYRDISFGNVFFEPGSGDVLICDNDNVGVDNGTRPGARYAVLHGAGGGAATRRTAPCPTPTPTGTRWPCCCSTRCSSGTRSRAKRTDAGMRDAQWLMTHFGTEPLFCMHPDRRLQPARPTSSSSTGRSIRSSSATSSSRPSSTASTGRARGSPRVSGSRPWTGSVTACSPARPAAPPTSGATAEPEPACWQ